MSNFPEENKKYDEENGIPESADTPSEEISEQGTEAKAEEPKTREFRGLYKYVKIPVKALDIIIIVCIAVIIIVMAIDLRNPGFTITFDSKGGTDVPAQNQMYGQLLDEPEPPTREGYVFTGWYIDHACYDIWDMENDRIEADMTLYAGWEKS